MYAIKMNSDKSLVTTVKAAIYQYEKNADTLVFLLPMSYEDKNISDCTVLLRYILPNQIGRSEELEMCPEPYKNYYQYRLKVASALTDVPGKIELWLSVIDDRDDLVLKSDSIFVEVLPSKDITKYLSSDDRNQLDKLSAKITRLEQNKADNIIYNEDEKYLQLTANGTPIGDRVDTGAIADDGNIIDFDKSPSDDTPVESIDDDIIYF